MKASGLSRSRWSEVHGMDFDRCRRNGDGVRRLRGRFPLLRSSRSYAVIERRFAI